MRETGIKSPQKRRRPRTTRDGTQTSGGHDGAYESEDWLERLTPIGYQTVQQPGVGSRFRLEHEHTVGYLRPLPALGVRRAPHRAATKDWFPREMPTRSCTASHALHYLIEEQCGRSRLGLRLPPLKKILKSIPPDPRR